MEEIQANTYEPLEGRRHVDPVESPETEASPPKDPRHIVYLSLLTAGIGFVLPYNRWAHRLKFFRLPQKHFFNKW